MTVMIIVLDGVLASAGCSPAARSGPLPLGPGVLQIAMTEYRFDLAKEDVREGRVVFIAKNEGRQEHEVVVLPLPADVVGHLDEELRSPSSRAIGLITHLVPRPSGAAITFALDLPPGNYGLVCFVQGQDGQTHAQKGMSAEFSVHPADPSSPVTRPPSSTPRIGDISYSNSTPEVLK